jgi:CRISPR-associated protein Cst1
MDLNNSIKISLDTFLINSCIIGFIKALESTNAIPDEDYLVENNSLYISKKYLTEIDLGKMYLDANYNLYYESSSIFQIKNSIAVILNDKENDEKKTNTKIKDIYKRLTQNSMLSAYVGLGDKAFCINVLLEKLKTEINIDIKKQILKEIDDEINHNEYLRKILVLKNIMYSKLNLFWDGKAFLNGQRAKNDPIDEYNKVFIEPLKENISNNKIITEKYYCSLCGQGMVKKGFSMSFIQDFGEDDAKKKSPFWNEISDMSVCPICNYLITFMPFGFVDIGSNMLFVNSNDSINSLININTSINFNEEDKNRRFKVINSIIERVLEIKTRELNNIQIIYRIKNDKHNYYSMEIISKDILKVVDLCKNELNFIAKIYLKGETDKEWINVFDECITNLLNFKNQFSLIYKILKIKINENVNFLMDIIKIQIYQKGGESMKNFNQALVARNKGRELRCRIGGQDADNKLRGLVYQLVNSVHTGNSDLFFSNIIRLYTSMNMQIPDLLINMMNTEDDFKILGYAYILGLKGDNYNEKNHLENKGE